MCTDVCCVCVTFMCLAYLVSFSLVLPFPLNERNDNKPWARNLREFSKPTLASLLSAEMTMMTEIYYCGKHLNLHVFIALGYAKKSQEEDFLVILQGKKFPFLPVSRCLSYFDTHLLGMYDLRISFSRMMSTFSRS